MQCYILRMNFRGSGGLHSFFVLGASASLAALPVLAPSSAAADAASAERVEGCQGLPARAKLSRHDPVGESAVHVVARSGERFLVFPATDENECEVYPLARPASLAGGRFGFASKAMALRPEQCSSGACPVAIAVRGKAQRPLQALRAEVHCDAGVRLRPLKLFADRDSLELVCQSSAGAGWKEQRLLLDVAGDTLLTLLRADTGSYLAPTPEEQKAGRRAQCPVGSLRVEQTGAAPLLRHVDPSAATAATFHDGKGTLPARQLGYDARRHVLVPTGAPDIPTAVDARAACRRR
jgi:hypothetical protein